ncbi:hypothetical protein D3C86_1276740 [compost metagenome]
MPAELSDDISMPAEDKPRCSVPISFGLTLNSAIAWFMPMPRWLAVAIANIPGSRYFCRIVPSVSCRNVELPPGPLTP